MITFAMVFSCFIFLVGATISTSTEFVSSTLGDIAFYDELPMEKLDCKSLTISDWRELHEENVNGLVYHYFYVTKLSIEVSNEGDVSYTINDLKYFDVFLVFSKNAGNDSEIILKSSMLRILYKQDCSNEVAPCWRIERVSSLAEPNSLELIEVVNPSSAALAQGLLDPKEIAHIDIYIPHYSKFTVVQILNGSSIVCGDGWIYVALVTSKGHVARPLNLFKKTWSLGEAYS